MANTAPVATIPNFVNQYYKTSTFHHLSSWKAQLKQSQTKLSNCADTLDLSTQKFIVYIDMAAYPQDCFYVSVARRDNPGLDNREVIVCPTSNFSKAALQRSTSEISSASYEARDAGVRSRMFIKDAYALCPNAEFISCDYKRYESTSKLFFSVLHKYAASSVTPLSVDEATIDLSLSNGQNILETVQTIRDEILEITGCPCSAGIGPNLLLAKLALSRAKPNGKFQIKESNREQILSLVLVKELPGVGDVAQKKLGDMGVHYISDLRTKTKAELVGVFGPKKGDLLFHFGRGVDTRPPSHLRSLRKSIGTQLSWGIRFEEKKEVQAFLGDLALEVQQRLKLENLKASKITLTVKVKHPDGSAPVKYMNPGRVNVVSKSSRLPGYSDDASLLAKRSFQLFLDLSIPISDIRGFGIQLEELNNQVTASKSALGSTTSPGKQKKMTSFFQPKPK